MERNFARFDGYDTESASLLELAILLEGTYARACAGKAPQDVGERLHGRAKWLFARAARWMQQGVLG